MISTTPLWCTDCTKGLCEDEKKISQHPNGTLITGPHNIWWLKQYCTLDPKTVNQFLLYFPYVLLIVALTLFAIERAFTRFFKATKQLEAFYNLIVKENIIESKSKKDEGEEDEKENDGKDKDEAIEHNKLAYSVSNGSSSNYFRSYLIRTIAELLISTGIFSWLIINGYEPFFGDNGNSQGSAIYGTKAVLCNIDVFWYHCTGIPFQFYLIIFMAALVLLLLYILSCSYVLVWLLVPSIGNLSNAMDKFASKFEELHELDENEVTVEGLKRIYYENRDTQLLLDLLTASSGIGPCLKLLCLFDKSLQQRAQVENVGVTLEEPDTTGKRDAVVCFKDSKAVTEIFSQIPTAFCTYAVEINPSIPSGSWRILNYAKNEDTPDGAGENVTENLLESGKGEKNLMRMYSRSLDTIRFKKLAPDVNYQVTISTQINGTIVAVATSTAVKFTESQREQSTISFPN